ncbi:MAG: hypothetical protein K2X47_11725 [Bdellovibrionales bacterium]|nr:hypothetical protein [Bdellovibrionales bacterium]
MAKKETKGGGNVTLERLSELPFKSAKELKDAEHEVHMQVWRRLEEAKVMDQLLKRDDYRFWHDEFAEGLVCGYGEKTENLVRVYSRGKGIKIDINKDLAATVPSSEALIGALVRSMSESFATTYYRAKGILVRSPESEADANKSK